MDYELYHDESLVGGYWHGMLLIPVFKKDSIVEYLDQARLNSGYSHPLGIKRVRVYNRVFDCSKAWMTVAVASLRSKVKGDPIVIYLGKKRSGEFDYVLSRERMGVKFILFCERDNLNRMVGYTDQASKIETTFRMGLKGGLHFLGTEEEPIRIERFHFDGHEHHKRHIDRDRIIGRLDGLRDYCKIATHGDLFDDRSSDHRKDNSQDYVDCQFLQLTDLMIGAFRSVLRKPTREIHISLAYPIRSLIDRYRQGYVRMRNSRWRNSFCMSQCYIADDKWQFDSLDYQQIGGPVQLPLPFIGFATTPAKTS